MICSGLRCERVDRLRLAGFTNLRGHKFRHNFVYTINSLCPCSLEIKSTKHCFLCYQNYFTFHTPLINKLNSINSLLKYDFWFIALTFWTNITFFNIWKSLINLVLLDNHGRVEYQSGKTLEESRIEVEMNMKVFNFLPKMITDYKIW